MDREIAEIKERMIQRATEGIPADQARQIAIAALHAPSSFKIPTVDELKSEADLAQQMEVMLRVIDRDAPLLKALASR